MSANRPDMSTDISGNTSDRVSGRLSGAIFTIFQNIPFRKQATAIFAPLMRLLSFLLLLLVSALPVSAQKYKRTLRGEVRIAGHPPQYYYIYYTANGAKLTGYSVTQSPNGDLKATLIGRLSDDGQEMYLRETQSMDYDEPGSVLCFFAARLTLTKTPGRRVWNGPFSSRQPDGTPCDGGVMTFVDLDPTPPPPPKPQPKPEPKPEPKLKPQPKPQPKPEPKPDPKPEPRKTETIARLPILKPVLSASLPDIEVRTSLPLPIPVAVPPKKLPEPVAATPPPVQILDTAALQNTYRVRGDSIVIELWDGVQNDGDVISVRYNGRDVLVNERLQQDRRILILPVTRGHWSELAIFLHSEGAIPENTVAMILKDGAEERAISINGFNGQVARLYFRKTD